MAYTEAVTRFGVLEHTESFITFFLPLVFDCLSGLKDQKQVKTTSERLFIILLLLNCVSLFKFLLFN